MTQSVKKCGPHVSSVLAVLGFMGAVIGYMGLAGGIEVQANEVPPLPKVYQLVASLGGECITLQDVDQRARLMCCLLKMPLTSEILHLVKPFILRQLKQELWLKSLQASQPLKPRFQVQMSQMLQAQMNLDGDELRSIVSQPGIGQKAWDSLVEARITMNKIMGNAFQEGALGAQGYDACLHHLYEDQRYDRIHLAELRIPACQGLSQSETQRLATLVFEALRQGALFVTMAQLFCPQILALRSGEWGWVREEAIAPFYAKYVKKMGSHQISPPIPMGSGYTIIGVLGRSERLAESDMLSLEQFKKDYGAPVAQIQRSMAMWAFTLRLCETPKASAFIEG